MAERRWTEDVHNRVTAQLALPACGDPGCYTNRPGLARLKAGSILGELADIGALADPDLAQEVAELRALFDLQWTRMAEATALWRQESPDERALVMPDLGDLLGWLLRRIQEVPDARS